MSSKDLNYKGTDNFPFCYSNSLSKRPQPSNASISWFFYYSLKYITCLYLRYIHENKYKEMHLLKDGWKQEAVGKLPLEPSHLKAFAEAVLWTARATVIVIHIESVGGGSSRDESLQRLESSRIFGEDSSQVESLGEDSSQVFWGRL